ncbi:ERAD-associated E3 ubiquitin-protein ligase HRD1 isoform X3 [Sorghum bicolor]|uniref:ERAD-associated E3 ubiquitin-protein ligase HRD1 isoform X3 n=1 Tax=Sorghum bicolor TaxID=4558 RepID=UPI000B424AC8|nr:ERAD-associated E3 ubiquitin-protein ligase HRD1 isoform X3 [Sorghum bicolor]|eukprot:XP_021317190.1 ERAD-associated E3 ubiquitin-protein ligase HRD1 isoform X3 [Sorghum bicolor]
MIRLPTYAAFSLLATASAAYYAFSSREQFYPAMVYLSTSKICFVLLLNTGLVAMCVAWQLARRLFLGPLREAEVERLNEQSWREVIEILFAVTIFRQDFSVSFLAMVAALLLVKALHWLAQKRVEYIETTPSVPLLSHVRIVSFMVFLLTVDCLFLSNSLRSLIQKREASVAIFFSFEYMILATSTVSTFVKYIFYVSDMLMEGQWERKAVYTFYLELISDLVHLSLYMLFFIAIFLNYGVPLHLIRELYETFRNFRIRIADYVRYRKITSNMNERFPDATAEELDASDATCIICREEMTTAKKLLCGHLFHVHCLRSWLERQHTCPTCRAPIIPADNGRAASARQHGAQAGVQPGTATPSSEGAPGENISRRQAKLEAAAAAASLYGRSFVYPPANTLNSRSGPPQSTSSTPQSEASSSNQSQKDQEMQLQNSSDGLVPLHVNANGAVGSGTSTRDLENSLQKAQENFIKSQIEMLQIQLQMVQRGAAASASNNGNAEHRKND